MTEEQRIAELMKPRFLVLEGWPGSENFPFHKGDIIIQNKQGKAWESIHGRNVYFGVNPDMHPHLFKRLEWHEERKQEEMPEYVKQEYDSDYDYDGEGYLPEVYKSGVEFNYMYSNESHLHIASFKTGGGCSLSYLLPATLAEYLQYINSKPQP